MSSRKRMRGVGGVPMRVRRAVDKQLIHVRKTVISPGTASTDLITMNRAGTVVGIRWSLNAVDSAGEANGSWLVIVLREGTSLPTVSGSDGSTLMAPEQQVLAFGAWGCGAGTQWTSEGGSKTMRKLRAGDKLVFVLKTDAATGGATVDYFIGNIQFFIKE